MAFHTFANGGLLMATPRHLLTSLLVLALLIAPLPAAGQEGVNSDDGAGSALPLERPSTSSLQTALDASQSAGPSMTVSDGDFGAGWTSFAWIEDDYSRTAPGPGTSTSTGGSRLTSGGNPGAYWSMTHTAIQGDAIFSGSLKSTAVFTPADGALTAFRLSMDVKQAQCCSTGTGLLLEQDGITYIPSSGGFRAPSAWRHIQQIVTADDFRVARRAPGAPTDRTQPDFSTAGAPIRVGLFFGNILAPGALGDRVTITVGFDNWTVTSNPPAEPVVSAIEVTQGVQDLYNSVALIAERSTTVRVYLSSPAGAVISPTVQLIGLGSNGAPLPGSPLTPTNAYAKIPRAASRVIVDSTANFALPTSWTSGTVELAVRVNGEEPWDCAMPNAAYGSPCSVQVRFGPAAWLDLQIAPVTWEDIATGRRFTSDQADLYEAMAKIRALLPVSGINAYILPERPLLRVPGYGSQDCYGYLVVPNPITCQLQAYSAYLESQNIEAKLAGVRRLIVMEDPAGDPVISGGVAPDHVALAVNRGLVPAHETGHTLSLNHAPCGSAAGADSNYPYPDARISPVLDGPRALFGFDPQHVAGRSAIANPDYKDLMSYCSRPGVWLSDYHYEKAYYDLTGYLQANAIQAEPPLLDSTLALTPTTFLVSGVLTPSTLTAVLNPVLASHAAVDSRADLDTTIRIRVLDGAGQQLGQYDLEAMSDAQLPDTVIVNQRVPYNALARRIELIKSSSQQVLAARDASANPPTVTLLTPNGGEALAGSVTVQWAGSDPDGDALTYVLWYTGDSGQHWTLAAGPTPATQATIDVAGLGGSTAGYFRVGVSDGLLIGVDQSDAGFSVPNRPPTATIQWPPSDRLLVIGLGDRLVLSGVGWDPDTGPLPDSGLRWLVGSTTVASGESAVIDATALGGLGLHTITFEARDGGANIVTTTATVEIAATRPTPPTALSVPEALTLEVPVGARTRSQDFGVLSLGVGEVHYTIAGSAGWLQPASGMLSTDLPQPLWINTAGLSVGSYEGSLTLTALDGDQPGQTLTVPVSLQVVPTRIYLPSLRRNR